MTSIINISEAVSLALHSMVYIAIYKGNPVKIKQIAEYLNASETHLAKVLQTLSKKGFLRSTRGPNGGFILAKPAEEISFNLIYECIESEIRIESCPFHKESCSFTECIYGDFLNKIKSDIKEFFSNRYISELNLKFKEE